MAAKVVGAALHVADFEGAEERLEERDVFEVELLLEVFGASGKDDALLVLAGVAEGGQKVGEGFAGAGAGFDDEVTLVVEGGLDGGGHLLLAGAVLEMERRTGKDAGGGEELGKRGQPGELGGIRDGRGGRHCNDDIREEVAKMLRYGVRTSVMMEETR